MSDSIGPQKGPSSIRKIMAETKQAMSQLNELDSFWALEVGRGDKREFLLSEPHLLEFPDKELKKLKKAFSGTINIVFLECPEDARIVIVGRTKELIDAFVVGLTFWDQKEDWWEEMYNLFIDGKLNE